MVAPRAAAIKTRTRSSTMSAAVAAKSEILTQILARKGRLTQVMTVVAWASMASKPFKEKVKLALITISLSAEHEPILIIKISMHFFSKQYINISY